MERAWSHMPLCRGARRGQPPAGALPLSLRESAPIAGSSCKVIATLVLAVASVAFYPREGEDEAAIADQSVDPLTDRTDLRILAFERLAAVGLPAHRVKPEHPA